MNWKEYKNLSEKTMSTEFHCGKQVENLLHGVIGVITELEELMGWSDEINKKEEVADIFWYLALLDRELNLNFEIPNFTKNFTQLTNDSLIMQSLRTSTYLLDVIKKKLFYNKPLNVETFSAQTRSIFENLCTFCFINEIEIGSTLDNNIEKLKVRFGNGFSSERAVKRDLNLERIILEQQ